MMGKYLLFGIMFFLIFSGMSAYADKTIKTDSINIGPTFTIFDGFNKEVDIEDIPYEEELVFKFTLTNNKDDYWVCWDKGVYTMKIISGKYGEEEQDYSISKTVEGKNCIPPNSDISIWIPFEKYNNELDVEQRKGFWEVNSHAKLDGISCFLKDDPTKNICEGSDYIKSGNPTEVYVSGEIPTTHTTLSIWIDKLINGLRPLGEISGYLLQIIGVIAVILTFLKGGMLAIKKTKKHK